MKIDKELLFDLLSQPTAPYREGHVVRFVVDYLSRHGVKYFTDSVGNIVVGVESKAEYLKLLQQKTKEPVRLFMAHMDHPGFHGVRWGKKNELHVKWYGGSPTQKIKGTEVWLASISGIVGEGTVKTVKMNRRGTAIESLLIKVTSSVPGSERDPLGLFGGFQFRKPVWEKKTTLYTKAADDLIGVCAIVQLAVELKTHHAGNGAFVGLLTRAEEVGFIGAIGHFAAGFLEKREREVIVVSLETSRQLPGALIGKGPVVRVGDRTTGFEPGAVSVLHSVAQKVLPKKFQKRIMDGGSCEATAATVFGLTAIGISVPLGNYHNQSFEGGPDSRGALGPAPEFVDKRDIEGMLNLCRGIMQPGLPWEDPWKSKREGFIKSLHEAHPLLKLV